MTVKKRNPQDLTLRNLRALKRYVNVNDDAVLKAVKALEKRVAALEKASR